MIIKKKTTVKCKNQKIIRKVREASVKAIETIKVSLKILSVNHWTSSLSQ